MFKNMGRKIKILAQIFAWLGIIGSCLGGVALMLTGYAQMMVIGIVIAIVGSLISWISSFMLCGYGELIQSNTDLLNAVNSINETLRRQNYPADDPLAVHKAHPIEHFTPPVVQQPQVQPPVHRYNPPVQQPMHTNPVPAQPQNQAAQTIPASPMVNRVVEITDE